jgi:hypothetical protein
MNLPIEGLLAKEGGSDLGEILEANPKKLIGVEHGNGEKLGSLATW